MNRIVLERDGEEVDAFRITDASLAFLYRNLVDLVDESTDFKDEVDGHARENFDRLVELLKQ